jgi:hypothetical protein
MLLYVGKNFTSTASGSVIKEVNCEKCRGRYYYQLARAASASASAPYYIGQAWAQTRAKKGAARKLAIKLQRDSELVPCPDCHHVQDLMIRDQRRRMHRGLRMMAWAMPGVGLLITGVIAMVAWSAHPRRFADEDHNPYFIAAAVSVAAWIGLMLLRRFLVMRLGTRGNEHLLRVAMIGAPPALLPSQQLDANGQVSLRPAPVLDAPVEAKDEPWVVFPLLRIALPGVCCECLSPCSSIYRSLLSSEPNQGIRIPLCGNCAGKVRWRSWQGFAMAGAMCLSAAGLLVMLPMKMDLTGRVVLAVLIAVVASLLAAALVPPVLSAPFSYKVIDRERQIVRLCFRNPHYTRLLQELVAALEGDAEIPVAGRA